MVIAVASAGMLDQLRSRLENTAVLDAIAGCSAHGDLTEVLARHARKAGDMRMLFVADADYAALFATVRGSDTIVIAASGMSTLMIRSGGRPDGAELTAESRPDLGVGWWRVHPWDSDVTKAEVERELDQWFALATVLGTPHASST